MVREERERLHWLMASSPLEPSQVRARYSELERGYTKVIRIDEFMDKVAARKKAREAAQ